MVLTAKPGCIETDALIIGAGPVGLFQVFQLGLLEVKCHVIDTLDYPGGQCVELYPDKPIYDIPGVPVYTGQELAQNLLKQIAPLGAVFHFGQQVTQVEQQLDGRFFVETSKGVQFLSKTVFIAAGVGAFQARKLLVDGLEGFEGSQVFYGRPSDDDFAGKDVLIVGGEEPALNCALELAVQNQARRIVLLHRRDTLKAAPEKIALMRELCAAQKMTFMVGQVTGIEASEYQLSAAKITEQEGAERSVPLNTLLVFLGLSPKLGPLTHWGLDMERKQLRVDTEKFSTSTPGIFAVGDINTYPGKKKLLLCGFHECALAAFGAMPIIFPEKQVFLQYTTTSPRLHQILGVKTNSLTG
jgi:thioredoxin reductase (NADPH)